MGSNYPKNPLKPPSITRFTILLMPKYPSIRKSIPRIHPIPLQLINPKKFYHTIMVYVDSPEISIITHATKSK
jgi:hypothetical protein